MKRIQSPALLTIFLLAWLAGCTEKEQGPAAPLNDKASLEKLAQAYEAVSDTVPVSPVKLTPKARRKFVEQVFTASGYGYSATLLELANVQSGSATQLHKDMKDLLFMPHYGVNFEETKHIYSETELRAIEKINKHFP